MPKSARSVQKRGGGLFLVILAVLITARFVYAFLNPVTGDSVFYSLMSEFFAKEGILPTVELDRVGRIYFLPPAITVVPAVFFSIGDFFGAGRLFARMVAPVAGSLTIILTYLIASELAGNRRSALISAITFAALPLSLYLSTVLYIDMLLTFFVTLNIYILLLALRKDTTALWVGVTISLGLCVLTKFTAVALIVAYAAFAFISWNNGKWAKKAFVAAVFASVVFLAWNAYQLLLSGVVFLPYGIDYKSQGSLPAGILSVGIDTIKLFLSEFWLGIPFSYESIPRFFSILFGGYGKAMNSAAFLVWGALGAAFLLLLISGLKKSTTVFKPHHGRFLCLFIASFSLLFAGGLMLTNIGPSPRYLLPILPLVSVYAALGLERFSGRRHRNWAAAMGVCLVTLFLVQTGVGVYLTAKRVGGWDGCFQMVKDNVQREDILFYYGFPEWVIYHTGVRAYGSDLNIHGAANPSNHSLMYQLKTKEFLAYLGSYNVTYLYIDTGQSCGGSPESFYCKEFATSIQSAPNAQKVSSCVNPSTGGWGVLYRLS